MTKTAYVVLEIGHYHALHPSGYYMKKKDARKHLHRIVSVWTQAKESKSEKDSWYEPSGWEIARIDTIKVHL